MNPSRSLKALQFPKPRLELAGLEQRVNAEPDHTNGNCLNGSHLEASPTPADSVPSRNFKIVGAQSETLSRPSECPKQLSQRNLILVERLRGRLSNLTVLEACTLFTLLHRRDTGGGTLLKCAAAETGVSEALIVKISKKLGFKGF